MPKFPAAYCYSCDRFLGPEGSRKDAEIAKRDHGENMMEFEGTSHRISIFGSRSDFDRDGPDETEALA